MKTLAKILVVIVVAIVLVTVLFPGAVYQSAMRAERAVAGLETRSLDMAGIHYSYTDSDSGEPLVLLHGFTADKDHWTRVARYLTGEYRVIAPDLPGFGDSTRDPALDYSIDTQVGRIAAFVDRLGLEKFHLGGSSMGGAIAAVYAASHPDRVSSLWLLAPAGVVTDDMSDMERALFFADAHPLIPRNRQEFEKTLDFVFVKRPFLPGPLRRYLTNIAIERQDLRRQIFADLLDDSGHVFRTPLNDVLAGLDIPTLVVWGRLDRVLHPSGAAQLADLLTNETVELMSATGHLPMLETPRATAERYLRFEREASGR